MTLPSLVSPRYLILLRQMNEIGVWGRGGYKYANDVRKLAKSVKARTILDYGCGQGTLAQQAALQSWKVFEYDPGVRGKDRMPEPADIVVATDVLEHIEPNCLNAVLHHIHKLTRVVCYAVISTRPATKDLPNGRNAHLIVEGPDWWRRRFCSMRWRTVQMVVQGQEAVTIVARKR